MKRLWIGVVIMILLLGIGVGLLVGSQTFFKEFGDNLQEASRLALEQNWPAALEKAQESEESWNRYRRFWAAFTDHEPVEEVQNLFSQLKIYGKQRLEVDFATICQHLSHLAEAIDESHNLKWWSVL